MARPNAKSAGLFFIPAARLLADLGQQLGDVQDEAGQERRRETLGDYLFLAQARSGPAFDEARRIDDSGRLKNSASDTRDFAAADISPMILRRGRRGRTPQ